MIEELEEPRTGEGNFYNITCAILYAICWLPFGYALFYSSNAQFVFMESGLLDEVKAGFYGASLAIGAIFGALILGPLLNRKLKMKTCLILSLFISSLGWFLHVFIILPQFKGCMLMNLILLITSRILVSIGAGMSNIFVPVCVTEILPSQYRPILGFLPPMAMNIGIFISSIVGWICLYLDYYKGNSNITHHNGVILSKSSFSNSLSWPPLLGMLLTMVGSFCLLFVKDIEKEKIEDSTNQSYDPLLGVNLPFSQVVKQKFLLFKPKHVRRQFLVGFGVMFFQQMLGINAVLFNATSIFSENFKDDVSSPTIGALVGVILGGTIFASSGGMILASKYLKRNTLLYLASSLLFVCDMAIGFYFFFKLKIPILASTVLLIYVFVFSSSWSPIPWSIMSEIYCSDIQSIGCGFSTFITYLFTFIITISYAPIVKLVGIHCIFWFFSGMSILSIIFVRFCVPETKYKTLEEIQDLFRD